MRHFPVNVTPALPPHDDFRTLTLISSEIALLGHQTSSDFFRTLIDLQSGLWTFTTRDPLPPFPVFS